MNSSNVLKIYKNDKLEEVVAIDKIKALRGASLFYQCAIIIGDQNVNIGLTNCTVEELFAIISSDSENKEYRYYTEDYKEEESNEW